METNSLFNHVIYDDADGLYQGREDAQGRKNGFGELFYTNGGHIQYRGLWKDDERNGLGTSFTQDGHIKAEGHWRNNSLSGWGTLYYNTSLVFKGHFVKNQLSGHGIQLMDGQMVYEGQFEMGLRSGYGTEYYNTATKGQTIIYAGDWLKDHREHP